MENNKDKVSKKTKSIEMITDTYVPKKRKKSDKNDDTSNVTVMINNEVVEQLQLVCLCQSDHQPCKNQACKGIY